MIFYQQIQNFLHNQPPILSQPPLPNIQLTPPPINLLSPPKIQPMEQSNSFKDSLSIKYIAHYKASIRNGLFLHPDSPLTKQNRLIFPGANSIVSNTLSSNFDSQRHQSFFHPVQTSRGITCMTQSANRRLLAWAEETETEPVINCVDLATGKRKQFAIEVKSKKYMSLAFNPFEGGDPKWLYALTNGPQYTLIQWNFDKTKFVVNLVEKVDRIEKNDPMEKYAHLFFYKEIDFVVLLGQGVMKTVKLAGEKLQLKDSPFARKEISEKDFNFISYAIVKDGLVVGTDNGDILYFTANCQFKLILPTSPGEGSSVETLLYLHNSKSFIAGCGDGQLILYEKGDIKNVYVRSEKIMNLRDAKGKITSLTTTTREDYVFVGVEPGVVLRSSIEKNDDWQFDVALQSFHTDSITGLDICLRKPLFATCSLDKTVKIWNFSQKNNIQISKTFQQKASCLSFHPSGLHLAVCFPDKIRLISISNGDLIPYKDIPTKSCYDVKFSNGGHLFAVANSVMVQIFNFWTYEQSPGHQFKCQTGKFTYILWEEDDLGVFLGTSDGSVYYNKLEDATVRMHILSVPGFTVTSLYSLFYAKDEKQTLLNQRVVYVSGIFNQAVEQQQKCIFQLKITPKSEKDREIPKEEAKYTVSPPQKIYTACNISNMAMLNSHKLFLYTTDDKSLPGSLRFSKYPFSTGKELAEIQSHHGRVTKLCICYDDGLIFTSGEDGSLVIYEVKDKDMKIKLEILDSAEQFLYSKTQLKAQKIQLQELKIKNYETRARRDKIEKEQSKQRERLKEEWSAKNIERERQQSDKMTRLTEEMGLMQKEQTERLTMLEMEYKNKKTAVENDYKEKMLLQQTRKTELAKTKEQQGRTFNEILEVTKLKHRQEKETREQQLRNEQKREKSEKERLMNELQQMKRQHKIEQDSAENDAEWEVKVKIEDQQQSYRKLQEQNMKAEAEARAKKTALEGQIKKVAQENHKLSDTGDDLQRQKRIHQELQQKKMSHSKQIEEREKTIRDKMTRIQQLKKKTQELEKFKFVLDYKIKELKRDIGPRQEEIAKMKEQIANMNAEIIHFKRTNDNMRLIVKDLTSKRKGMEQELATQALVDAANMQYIKSFEIHISEMVQGPLQDFKKLKVKMIEIYRKYVEEDDDHRQMENVDHQKQFIKERQHLQSTVKSLKQKFKTHMKLHKADNQRIMGQNQDLISEINDLRRERKNMWDEVKKKNEQKEEVKRLEEEKLMVEREGEELRKKLQASRTQYEQALRRKTGQVAN